MDENIHNHYMSLALRLAEQGRLTVSPNPMVGCLIVKAGNVVGQGYHKKPGDHHAEIYAIKTAGKHASGATAYVTLEPCCHFGKTPPCTQAIIDAGIKKIYVACIDPNPLVKNKSILALRAAGLEVIVGECEEKAKDLNEIYMHYMRTRRPFVIAKWAMSLDGKTIVNGNDCKKISNDSSREHSHIFRQQVDAILIGANTLRTDDPELTVRYTPDNPTRHPIRIILSGNKNIPTNAKIFSSKLPGKTIIAVSERNKFLYPGIETIVLAENDQRISLSHLLDELGRREITSLLIEGGMAVHQSFFAENLINALHVYVAPKIIGNNIPKQHMRIAENRKIGDDYFYLAKPNEVHNV